MGGFHEIGGLGRIKINKKAIGKAKVKNDKNFALMSLTQFRSMFHFCAPRKLWFSDVFRVYKNGNVPGMGYCVI